ncbi:P13 family porin [Borrelia coriaceae]|uniref:P13 family porin n=1 Tax=Borrelia coriaceae TaxID=144 RepID=UPI003CCFE3E0
MKKKDTLVPFLLNFLLGFGIDSFVQGDTTGGLFVLGFDVLGRRFVNKKIFPLCMLWCYYIRNSSERQYALFLVHFLAISLFIKITSL